MISDTPKEDNIHETLRHLESVINNVPIEEQIVIDMQEALPTIFDSVEDDEGNSIGSIDAVVYYVDESESESDNNQDEPAQ